MMDWFYDFRLKCWGKLKIFEAGSSTVDLDLESILWFWVEMLRKIKKFDPGRQFFRWQASNLAFFQCSFFACKGREIYLLHFISTSKNNIIQLHENETCIRKAKLDRLLPDSTTLFLNSFSKQWKTTKIQHNTKRYKILNNTIQRDTKIQIN